MKTHIKNSKTKDKAQDRINRAKRDFVREFDEIKPFLRKRGVRLYRTTEAWEITNSNV
ncbi:hypothetical protein JW824_13700 [bacterium]|nr:hypothetical protein [bacterium]